MAGNFRIQSRRNAGSIVLGGFFPQEEGEFIQNLFEKALEPPYRSSYENQWRCREGGFRLISFTIAALFEKEKLKSYSVTGHDVTKLRRMEEELWQYRTDLEDQISQRSLELLDSRNRLAGIVDSAEDAIIFCSSENFSLQKIFASDAVKTKNLPPFPTKSSLEYWNVETLNL